MINYFFQHLLLFSVLGLSLWVLLLSIYLIIRKSYQRKKRARFINAMCKETINVEH